MRDGFRTIIKHRRILLALYLVLLLVCLYLRGLVGVNSDLTAYLPEDSASTLALRTMGEEFTQKIPNAQLMVRDVTLSEARSLERALKDLPGVEAVSWITGSGVHTLPLEVLPESLVRTGYRDGCALYTLTLDDAYGSGILDRIRALTDHETCMAGEYVQTRFLIDTARSEILVIVTLAVAFAILLLILTLDSLAEPFLLVACLIAAVVYNAGTNVVLGTVSTMTNIAASVLQMAVSVDYFIFILHRYREFRDRGTGSEEGMVQALEASFSSVLASSLTTIIGFMALTFMRYRIGMDLGIVLSKGVFLSLICAFTLLPCVIISCEGLIGRTRHRPLIRSAAGLSRIMTRIRKPAAVLFLLLVLPASLLHTRNAYYYGNSHSFREESSIIREREEIEEVFGLSNQMVLLVPAGHPASERQLVRDLSEMEGMTSVTALSTLAGTYIPARVLPESLTGALKSESYSRLVLAMDIPSEDERSFAAVERIRETAGKHFGTDYLLAGTSVSTLDLRDVITGDNLRVNLIAAAAIFLVLLLTFRRLRIPVLLTMTIEGCIWISMTLPILTGETLFYIGYLIISSILLGSTVDYAILVSTRFLEEKRRLGDPLKAAESAVSLSAVSIMISGLVLTFSGVLLYYFCSNFIMAQMGLLLARGTAAALTAVLFALPQLLLWVAGKGP